MKTQENKKKSKGYKGRIDWRKSYIDLERKYKLYIWKSGRLAKLHKELHFLDTLQKIILFVFGILLGIQLMDWLF